MQTVTLAAISLCLKLNNAVFAVLSSVRLSHTQETDEEFDIRYERFFSRPDIDGWEVRKAMNDLQGYDLVPEPKIVIAAMKACRRVNDYALAVRFLEAVKVLHYNCFMLVHYVVITVLMVVHSVVITTINSCQKRQIFTHSPPPSRIALCGLGSIVE